MFRLAVDPLGVEEDLKVAENCRRKCHEKKRAMPGVERFIR